MFYKYAGLFVVGTLVGGYCTQWVRSVETVQETISKEQHDLCYDTKKYEAWVAKKNGELRCFMEYREYPHRVKASYIESPT